MPFHNILILTNSLKIEIISNIAPLNPSLVPLLPIFFLRILLETPTLEPDNLSILVNKLLLEFVYLVHQLLHINFSILVQETDQGSVAGFGDGQFFTGQFKIDCQLAQFCVQGLQQLFV